MLKVFRIILIVAVMFVLTACHSTKKQAHVHPSKARIPHEGNVFSLSYCVAAALQHMTDLRIYELNKRIVDEKNTAKTLSVLYDLAKHSYFSDRNIVSRSVDNNFSTKRIGRILSVLDFSMAYFNSPYTPEYRLIDVKQKRRVEQNIKFAVTEIYFKTALAQYLIEKTEKLLLKCKKQEKAIEKLLATKTISQLRLLDERKRCIRLEKRLMLYRRNHQNACIELRPLIGYLKYDIKVETKCLEKLCIPTLPHINTLEKLALLNIQTNITVNEARKTIIKMCPQVKIFMDFTNSNNTFIYTQSWWEIGIYAAYNLLKLPQKLASYRAARKLAGYPVPDDISMRKLALSIGVIAQFRIAHANILKEKERYDLADKTYRAYEKYLKVTSQTLASGDALSKLKFNRYKLETDETSIKRLISMSDYYIAYYRLLNVLGVNSLDSATIKIMMNKIKRSEAKEKAKPLSKNIIKIYIKISNELTSRLKTNTLIKSR
jgi:outer membrane protein